MINHVHTIGVTLTVADVHHGALLRAGQKPLLREGLLRDSTLLPGRCPSLLATMSD